MPVETCPGCRGALSPDAVDGAYACAECGGRFLERRALRARQLELPRSLARKAPRKPRACAGCGSGMDTVCAAEITLDWCEDCGALYFDAGELEAVLAAQPATTFRCAGCAKEAPLAERRLLNARLLCESCAAREPRAPEAKSALDQEYERALRNASSARINQLPSGRDELGVVGHMIRMDHRLHHPGCQNIEENGTTFALLDALLHLFR